MHPRRPHGHCRPPSLTTMWPISPADARPRHNSPSSTTPPPTPVPQKTPSRDWYGRPAPRWNSAIVATSTSLPRLTGTPSSAPSSAASGTVPSQFGRLRALVTVPAAASTAPGEPTPAPARAPRSVPAPSAASFSADTIAARTSLGPPDVGVGCRAAPSTSPSSSTTTAWIFVPPRSTPARSVIASSLSNPGHAPGTREAVPESCQDVGERADERALRRGLDRVHRVGPRGEDRDDEPRAAVDRQELPVDAARHDTPVERPPVVAVGRAGGLVAVDRAARE